MFVVVSLFAASAWAASGPGSGLYGISLSNQLFRVPDVSTGAMDVFGPDLSNELLAQQVSTIDAITGTYFCLGYNTSAPAANIIGLSLASGAITSSAPIQSFVEPAYIGVGQNIAFEPNSGAVIISGQNAAQDHLYGTVNPSTGAFTLAAKVDCVPPKCLDMMGGPADYAPDTKVYLAQLGVGQGVDFEAVNMSSGAVVQAPDCDTLETLDYDKKSGAFYGIGLQTSPTVARILVKLAPDASTCTVVGTIPDHFMIASAVSAIDESSQILYWISAPGSYPVNYTLNVYNLIGTSLADASTVSQAPFCCFGQCAPPATQPPCPWSLEFNNA